MKSVFTVPDELKKQVERKLVECIAKAEDTYNISIPFPSIAYDINGKTAGYAVYSKWQIRLNPVLLVENGQAFIDDTPVHELAHLICFKVYPEAHNPTQRYAVFGSSRAKRDIHGARWQSIMRTLGSNPTRTHKFDTSNVGHHKTKYVYKCNCCGKKYAIGPVVHKNITDGAKYHGKCCVRGMLVFVERAGKVSNKQALNGVKNTIDTPATQKQNNKLPKTGTKLAKCLELYNLYCATFSRSEMINTFATRCGCTFAGATTYYSLCKKAMER